ncbi:MAG: hypothetical protein JWM61_2691 [Micrococcaceae bacterium]|nr:hypothetical protein [Micrococcaceae bacterium]
MNRRSRPPIQAPLREHRPNALIPAQALHPILTGRSALFWEFNTCRSPLQEEAAPGFADSCLQHSDRWPGD